MLALLSVENPMVPATAIPILRFCAAVAALSGALSLAACGDAEQAQVKSIKEQVKVAYGNKDFAKALSLA